MLDLSKISDLGLYYKDPGTEALQRLSDVIRSLSDVIVNQGEGYIQNYISLQTFDNNGDESTSQTRRNNASSTIQQQYRDVNILSVTNSCKDITFWVPDSRVTCTVGDRSLTFGFNGAQLFCNATSDPGNDIYFSRDGVTFTRPNMDIWSLNNIHVRSCYTVGFFYELETLNSDGSTSNKQRYIWVWFDSNQYSDSNGWYVPVYAIVKDVLGDAHIYGAPHAYGDNPEYGNNLLRAMEFVAQVGQDIFYLEPDNPRNFTYGSPATSRFVSNSLYLEWGGDSKTILAMPKHADSVLNTGLGSTACKLINIPGQIVQWIRSNS